MNDDEMLTPEQREVILAAFINHLREVSPILRELSGHTPTAKEIAMTLQESPERMAYWLSELSASRSEELERILSGEDSNQSEDSSDNP